MTSYKIVCGDCLEVLPKIKDESIDLIVTDPPYYGMREDFGEWRNEEEYFEWYEGWVQEADRVLKDNGSLYVFIPPNLLTATDLLIQKYLIWKQIIPWFKPNVMIRVPQRRNYFSKVEVINFYVKGEDYTWNRLIKKYGMQGACNVFIEPTVYGYMAEGVGHSTQKPLKIMEKIIYASSNEGDLVLDPFLGSGTTAVASKKLDRSCIGIEINPEYVKIAEERLLQAKPKKSLRRVFE